MFKNVYVEQDGKGNWRTVRTTWDKVWIIIRALCSLYMFYWALKAMIYELAMTHIPKYFITLIVAQHIQ